MTSTTLKRRLAALEVAEPKAQPSAAPYPGLVEAIRRRAATYPVQPIRPDEEAMLRCMAADLGKVPMLAGAGLDQWTGQELKAAEFLLWHAEHLRLAGRIHPDADIVEGWRALFDEHRAYQPKAIENLKVAWGIQHRAEGHPPPLTMLIALGIEPQARRTP